jgi:hypothetical protein
MCGLCRLEEVGEHRVVVFGVDGFGVELRIKWGRQD